MKKVLENYLRRRLSPPAFRLLLTAVCAVLVSAAPPHLPADAAETGAVVTVEAFGAKILVPIPFKRTKSGADFSEQNGRQLLAEFVPAGQSVYDWTEMVSLAGYDSRALGGVASFQVIDMLSQQISQACPDSFVYEVLKGPPIGNLETAAAFMGCKPVQNSPVAGLAAGQSELGLYVVAKAENAFFELHLSHRRTGDISDFDQPSDPAVRQAYQQFIARIRICNGQDDGACK